MDSASENELSCESIPLSARRGRFESSGATLNLFSLTSPSSHPTPMHAHPFFRSLLALVFTAGGGLALAPDGAAQEKVEVTGTVVDSTGAGLGGAMTLYLTRRAAADFREWGARGSALTLSVNISAADLADHALLAALADAAGPACPSLVLEVTETDIMGDPGRIASAVAQLRRRGIRLSIDDFGTGHSSLTKLRLLEADEIKIDRSFVRDVLQSRSDQAIVRSTIQLAHAVGAKVTAEGIEDGATLEWLTAAGCDYGQGFALARPMRPAGFGLMLAGMPVFKGAALS